MSKHGHQQISEFVLEGRFLGFIVSGGYKLKHIRLATAEGEFVIKLEKGSIDSLQTVLTLGDWLQCSGSQKLDAETGNLKLKADSLKKVRARSQEPESRSKALEIKPQNPLMVDQVGQKVNVLICQKSDCAKRGSGQVCDALLAALFDRDLSAQVNIKNTGCLKACKAGPNVVIVPEASSKKAKHGSRFDYVKLNEIPKIVEAISSQLVARSRN